MTTTVLIGTQGNKAVRIKSPSGDTILQPGGWMTLGIHGEQTLTVVEDGEFLSPPPMSRTVHEPADQPTKG